MAATTDELRSEIARQREEVSRDLDALGRKASPSRAVRRRTSRLRERAQRVRVSIMGTTEDASDRLGGRAHDLGDEVRHAPEMARERVEGSPIAVGLMAYGAGMLVASLLPPTESEQELARAAEPVVRDAAQQAADAGREVVADLREPAGDAAQEVASSAREGASASGSTTPTP